MDTSRRQVIINKEEKERQRWQTKKGYAAVKKKNSEVPRCKVMRKTLWEMWYMCILLAHYKAVRWKHLLIFAKLHVCVHI